MHYHFARKKVKPVIWAHMLFENYSQNNGCFLSLVILWSEALLVVMMLTQQMSVLARDLATRCRVADISQVEERQKSIGKRKLSNTNMEDNEEQSKCFFKNLFCPPMLPLCSLYISSFLCIPSIYYCLFIFPCLLFLSTLPLTLS